MLVHGSDFAIAVTIALVLGPVAAVSGGVQVAADEAFVAGSDVQSDEPGSLVPEGYALEYVGENVSEITVYVDNTGIKLQAIVRAELVTTDGTVIASGTETTMLGTGRNEVTVSLSGAHRPSSFAFVRTSVESGDL